MVLKLENKVVLATQNPGKVLELQKTWLGPVLEPLPNHLDQPVEDGQTCEENALIKARYYHQMLGRAVLSDDSGFFIKKLSGYPGVHSAPIVQSLGGYRQFFELIENKAKNGDEAYFLCVLAYKTSDGQEYVFKGKLEGSLSFPARGEAGFGFDPIFVAHGYQKTLAQMSLDEKNSLSHRHQALQIFSQHFTCP